MTAGQRRRLLAAAVVIALVIGSAFLLGSRQDWKILFANLSDKDAGAVAAQLSQSGVPYRHVEGGAILVPADKVHETRLRLAAQGLPKGSIVGFELMDNPRLGITQFQERLSFQRGLEGELTRSIQALGPVQGARVHLALPNQNGFFREQQKPSASVLVSLLPGRSLDRAQIAGIVHLVSSSVPELDARAVSVVDGSGNLLSDPPGEEQGADLRQLGYVRQLEQGLVRRIHEILTPVLGAENVRAQVTVDVDFTRTELTSESHQPNSQTGAVRSQQVVESTERASGEVGGVPGAATNQPGAAAPEGAGATPPGAIGRKESVTNFEVDRTVKMVRQQTGVVRRVTAAVVVNHVSAKNEDGETELKALDPERMAQLQALVRDAIGFSAERGDSVNLMNAPFSVEKLEVPVIPWWQHAEIQRLIGTGIWVLGIVLTTALILFVVVKPLLSGLRKAAEAMEPLVDAVISEDPPRPEPPPALQPATPPPPREPIALASVESDDRLKDARRLSAENPAAVAGIMKSWMQSDNA